MRNLDLQKHKDALERYFAAFSSRTNSTTPGVVLAYLFGSHARGQAWAHSDVDVAVLLEDDDSDHCIAMRLEIIGGLMELLPTMCMCSS